jgi:DNA-binding CsgD family transcriptional regulator
MVLLGRDAELADLVSAVADERPVLVLGEAGVGKTALLRAATAASGRAVFEGGALSTLSWIEYLALTRALGRDVDAGDGADETRVAADVERTVGSGVLVLDDLQWAHPATLDVVELLAGRLPLLVAVRSGEPAADGVADRLRQAGFRVVELAGLSSADAVELARAVRPDMSRSKASRLAARTGGNPLLVSELAESGEPSPSLRRALEARLRRLDDAGREAFALLALAARPLPVDLLGRVGTKSVVAAHLADATAQGLVVIRHALLGEIAVDGLAEEEVRRLHGHLAGLLADDAEAARHYLLAGQRADAHAAALRAAAAADRPGERASHLAVAALCADGADANQLRLKAAWALEETHDWAALNDVLDGLDTDDPELRATGKLILARAAWRAGDVAALRTALADGLALVTGTGGRAEIGLRIEQSRIPIFVELDPEAALRSTAAALELARAGGVDVARARYLRGTGLWIAARLDEAAEELEAALRQARATGDLSTELLTANNLVALHESGGDPQTARCVAAEYAQRAAELRMGVWERSFRFATNNLDFHAGEYAAVVEVAEQLLALPLEMRTRESVVEQLCLALVDLGRIDEAERRVAAEPQPGDDWTSRRARLIVLAEAALWGGRPRRALELVDEWLAGPEGDQNVVLGHATRAWACFDLERDPGPPISGTFTGMLSAVPDEVRGVGLLHVGEYEAAVEAFDAAAAVYARYHRRGEVRCRWAAGEAARRGGRTDAIERLLAAERRAEQFGMVPLLGRVHRSLRAAGVRRSAVTARAPASLLTARERDVLRLVAEGRTNAEIASRLGVSRHTVVSQIASASAKLGARSRSHAATLAAAHERAAS